MEFPQLLKDSRRWMVRPTRSDGEAPKQPKSVLASEPFDYEPPAGETDPTPSYWRWRWNCEPILADYSVATSFLSRQADEYEGLTFVVHHFGDLSPKDRIICLDFDKCVDLFGVVDPEVQAVVDALASYTEFSRSGTGLHVFVTVIDCPAFKNVLRAVIGGCRVDVLCSNAVAVTGNVYGEFRQVSSVAWDTFDRLPFFVYKRPVDLAETRSDWWGEDPLDDVLDKHEYLIPQMQIAEAVEGNGGSQVLFAAACNLARHGITGREAEPLLRLVPATPPFDASEIKRTIECAYNAVTSDGQYNTEGIDNEFQVLGDPVKRAGSALYGFDVLSVEELENADLRIEWIVEGAFVDGGSLFIGGREKCFKTGIAMDLMISLATGCPFLGHFPIIRQMSSVIFTAEIGKARAKHLIETIRDSKGLSKGAIKGMDVVDSVPSFGIDPKSQKSVNEAGLNGLKRFFRDRKPQIAVFDPLYFAMGGNSVGDMYATGVVLRSITEICANYGVMPVFCHHARKDSTKEGQPMGLSDLYGSGIAAFARQWLLLSHSEPFANGTAKLFGMVGGSSQGARGLWNITIDEGEPDDIMDRVWHVSVDQSDGGAPVDALELSEAFKYFEFHATKKQLSEYMGVQPDNLNSSLRGLMKSRKISVRGNKYIWND